MNIGDLFERNARCFPCHPAVIFEGRTLTYRELERRARSLAAALRERGLGRGDRVAILAQNCPEYLELFGACALGGCIAVGINYRLAAPEQAAILRDCEPRALVFEPEYAGRVAELRASLPPSVRLLCTGEAPAWAERYETAVAQAAADAEFAPPRDDDTLLLVYTSGTTGRSKGVMLSSGGQLEQARILALAHGSRQDDRMLIVMPFYHIGGTTELLTYAVAGATIVLHRAFDPAVILDSIAAHRVSAAHLAPTMIQMMIEVQEASPRDLSSLHTVCYASAPMSIALSRRARAVFGPIFMQIYGMTEHGPGTVLLKHQHVLDGAPEQVRRLASAGQPLLGVELRVVRDDGTDCGVGEIGEVWLRSGPIMQGYWRNPEATAQAIGDGWMHTGDLGFLDDENFLFVVDRKKDMIISGGENIYSREVEEALLLHPAVAEAAVIGVPDERWGESVKAVVSLKPGSQAGEPELIEHCRSLVASYKKPRSVAFMAALPRLASTNKIDKKKLREPYWAGRDRQV